MSALTYGSDFTDKNQIHGAFIMSHLLLLHSSMIAGGLGQGHHWQCKDSHPPLTHTADGGGDVKPFPDWPVGHTVPEGSRWAARPLKDMSHYQSNGEHL